MLEDFRLKVFEAVAETGSFTKAAMLLAVSQPAVSQNIAELEKLAGCSLFERSYGKVELTPQGQVFKSYADKILMWYGAAGKVFVQDSIVSGPLRIGCGDELCAGLVSKAVVRMSMIYRDLSFDISPVSDECDIVVLASSGISNVESDARYRLEVGHTLVCRSSSIGLFNGADTVQTLLEKNVRLAVWSGYRDVLPLELQASTVLWSYSFQTLMAFIASDPVSACLVPSPMASDGIASRSLVRIPSDYLSTHTEIVLLPSQEMEESPVFHLFADSLGIFA